MLHSLSTYQNFTNNPKNSIPKFQMYIPSNVNKK